MKRPPAARAAHAPFDWSRLQTFLAVCEAGTAAGAARRLGTSHATVVRHVDALERALGAPLFRRESDGFRPTPSARALRDRLAGMPARLDEAWRGLHGADESLDGLIRVTTTDTLMQGLLGPHLRRFCERHPGVRLQVIVQNQFLSLARRDADVAVRGTNRPPETLLGRHVGDIQTRPYAAASYLAGRKRRALASLDWVAPHESLQHLDQAKWLRRHVPPERVALRLDSLVGMADAVAAGAGAGMLLRPLAEQRPGLVALRTADPVPDTQIWVLSHPDLRQVARIRAFTAFLHEALGDDPRLAHRR